MRRRRVGEKKVMMGVMGWVGEYSVDRCQVPMYWDVIIPIEFTDYPSHSDRH